MDEGHKTRLALNEATYRKVDEAMRADGPENVITVVCECARLGCNALIRLSRAEYGRVRSNARRSRSCPVTTSPGSRTSSSATTATRTFEKHPDVDDVVKPTDP